MCENRGSGMLNSKLSIRPERLQLGRYRKYIARFFFWVVLPFFLIELSLTVLDPYLFKGSYQYDPDMGFMIRPNSYFNSVSSNQFGFNDQDYSLQKPSGTYRVLVVGDSFNWIGGRDGNYVGRLRRMLKHHYGDHSIDVINAGYPGTHSGEQLVMLKKYGLQYNPDLVVLGFFAGNDFFDANPHRKTIVINDSLLHIDRRDDHKFHGFPVVLQSRILLLLQQRYRMYRNAKDAQAESEADTARGKPRPKGALSEENFLNIERARLGFFNLKSNPAFKPQIDYAFESISEIDLLLKSRGINFMVAIYPDEFQVNQELFDLILQKYQLKEEEFDRFLAQSLLKTFLTRKGIPFVDFLDQFRVEGQKQDLYLPRNTHWNESGNQLAADILFNDLVTRIDRTRKTEFGIK